MKPAHEWTEADLAKLPIGEHDGFEKKGSDAFAPDTKHGIEQLAKACSAMANTGGGLIFWGIHDRTGEVDEGGVPMNIKNGTKSWLEDVIPNLLEFQLRGFTVHPIEASDPPTAIQPGRAVYVIEIPDSPDAPHMAAQAHVYFARIGGKSLPIGHRLVMDMANRRRVPDLQLWAQLQATYRVGANVSKVRLSVGMINRGKIMARFPCMEVHSIKQSQLRQPVMSPSIRVDDSGDPSIPRFTCGTDLVAYPGLPLIMAVYDMAIHVEDSAAFEVKGIPSEAHMEIRICADETPATRFELKIERDDILQFLLEIGWSGGGWMTREFTGKKLDV